MYDCRVLLKVDIETSAVSLMDRQLKGEMDITLRIPSCC
jgi:hypothetical protein